MSNPYLTPELIQGLYAPAALLIVGTSLIKAAWLPYALVLSVVLGGYRFTTLTGKGGKPVLKPDVLQEYPLIKKTVISSNTAIYRFALPTENSILGLPIGQHISISANLDVASDPKDPNSAKVKKDIVRSYTPISGDHEPGHFDLLIKAYPTGNISKYMAGLKVGQSIKVKGPKGAMVYTPNMVRHFGMIAGGTGITPMLQIIRAVIRGRASGDKTEIDLLFANVNVEDILLKDDLDKLAREDKGFRVHYVLNNPPEKWTGDTGFVTPAMMEKYLPKPASDNKILLCGPPPMIAAMKKGAEGLGWAKARPVSKLEDQVFSF